MRPIVRRLSVPITAIAFAAWSLGVCGNPAATAAPQTTSASADNPSTTAADERIKRLVRQLGDSDFFVRQWAQEELARLRHEAFDALTLAENDDDIEIAERARYLLRLLPVEAVLDTDPPEVKRILEHYENASEQGRILMANQLAELSDGKGLPALCRVLRFDRSQQVSKQAALKLINRKSSAGEDWSKTKALLIEGLARSPRPAAEWLRVWIATRDTPKSSAEAWSRLAAAEARVLRQQPQQSSAEIVIGLLKQDVKALRALGRNDDAIRAMREMVSLEPDDATLSDMLAWLVEQKAWKVVEEAAERFADRFEQEPTLFYALAEACRAQGNEELAQQTAARALALHHDNPRDHWQIAYDLQRRSWFRWAEGEYRQAMAIGPADEDEPLRAAALLGDMLHDIGRDADAAAAYEILIKGFEERRNAGRPVEGLGLEFDAARGQMYFFKACAAELMKDHAAQQVNLMKGLSYDPENADILIGLYRLPNADAAVREATLTKIRQAAESFRNQILQSPADPRYYNQLAWLIANTEGDYQEALHCSQKSLELRPNDGGFLDTLGRCYYAVGDFENAVKTQTEAVEKQPWSGLIRKQLDTFQKALERSKHKN
ncbi:MAG TPA: hypothetical protein VG713_10040 [Pirellulales bacterium]|nr:hypothetical protein [Pirellulales bacterium]